MCFAAIGTDIFPGTLREVTCPCDTGYFWALVTDGVAIHPKHAEDVAGREKKREEERYKERERERGGDIYTCFCCPWKNHIDISIYQSERQIDSSIHQPISQLTPQSPIQNHELPHPHSNSSLHNSRVMRCTHPDSSSSSSSSSSSLHKPIISISHNNLLITYSLTPKPKNSQQQECMAVTGGVGHGSGTCYRGTAESGIGQTCREVSETRRPFFFSVIHSLERSTDVFFWWKIGCAMLQ